jgi:F-type H+-transporting ATPase subunit delta
MDITIISKRYAKALFALALERDLIEPVYQDMLLIDDVMKHNRNLRYVMSSPIIPGSKKINIIQNLLKGRVSELTFKFTTLVLKKDRALLIRFIAGNYIDLYNDHHNIVTAKLITAIELNEDTRKELMKQLETISQKTIELEEHVKKDLIGGFVLRFKDAIYDASLRNKLDSLSKEFEQSLQGLQSQ